jgi:putative ABC transport system permease protein
LFRNDAAGRLPVVVVSEEFARQAWPEEDPLGKRVRRVRAGQTFPWLTVVGVVKNVKEDVFNYRINRPVWYVPYAQMENDYPLSIVIRTTLDPAGLIPGVRDAVRQLDPQQPISDVTMMNANLSRVLVTERFGAVLMGALALSGLILASIGLYGVMAYSVSRRTGEIGLRVALGAQPKDVLTLILGAGVKLTLLGVTIGLVAAWGTTRLLGGLLFGLSATDGTTFAAISVLLATIGLLASYFPARAAMRLNPVQALRYE